MEVSDVSRNRVTGWHFDLPDRGPGILLTLTPLAQLRQLFSSHMRLRNIIAVTLHKCAALHATYPIYGLIQTHTQLHTRSHTLPRRKKKDKSKETRHIHSEWACLRVKRIHEKESTIYVCYTACFACSLAKTSTQVRCDTKQMTFVCRSEKSTPAIFMCYMCVAAIQSTGFFLCSLH